MISMDTLIYVGVAIAAIIAGIAVARYIRWRIQPLGGVGYRDGGLLPGEVLVDGVLDFGDPFVRERLQRMIDAHRLSGSVDIRDGKVYEPVSLDRMHPLLGLINGANMALQNLKNPAACSLYVRDSVNDRFMLVPELDLDDLREIGELLRAAVAERIARSQANGN